MIKRQRCRKNRFLIKEEIKRRLQVKTNITESVFTVFENILESNNNNYLDYFTLIRLIELIYSL